uniref:ADP-ribosylation factor-like protein 13B n=1 Tax=Palpitomonas bilix TaxID=652834 RepID=A0A7S3DEW0_9EUKA|mmetsp:Transcript_34738/g.90083  ORF Transcript_34738/g.90083 Transcript_34738/m.90083 type:complete len:509 (+) Transcript_34738:228-1754(+)
MFSLFRNLVKYIKNKRERKVTIILLGIDNAGKTTVFKGIQGSVNEEVAPTAGFNTHTMKESSLSVTIFDVGGGNRIRGIWERYYSEVHGVVFLIDSTDPTRFDEVKEVLGEAMNHRFIKGKPVLFLANKQDLPEALSPVEVEAKLGLSNVTTASHRIQPCTALVKTAGEVDANLKSGVKWLLNTIAKDYVNMCERVAKDYTEQQEVEEREKQERKKRIEKRKEERRKKAEEEERRKKEEEEAAAAAAAGGGEATSASADKGGEKEKSDDETPTRAKRDGNTGVTIAGGAGVEGTGNSNPSLPPLPRRSTREGWTEGEAAAVAGAAHGEKGSERAKDNTASGSKGSRRGSKDGGLLGRRGSGSIPKNKVAPEPSSSHEEEVARTNEGAALNDSAPGVNGRRGSTGSYAVAHAAAAPSGDKGKMFHSLSQNEMEGRAKEEEELLTKEKEPLRVRTPLDGSSASGGKKLPPLRKGESSSDSKGVATPSLITIGAGQELVGSVTEDVSARWI